MKNFITALALLFSAASFGQSGSLALHSAVSGSIRLAVKENINLWTLEFPKEAPKEGGYYLNTDGRGVLSWVSEDFMDCLIRGVRKACDSHGSKIILGSGVADNTTISGGEGEYNIGIGWDCQVRSTTGTYGVKIGTSNQVDLQAVSIDPSSPIVNVKEKFQVVAVMKNNGPDELPAKDGFVQISVDNRYVTVPREKNFKSDYWELQKVKRSLRNHTVTFFLKNTKAAIRTGESAPLEFTVVGRRASPGAMVTLASTVTGSSSDVDGNNQSVQTQVVIIPKDK